VRQVLDLGTVMWMWLGVEKSNIAVAGGGRRNTVRVLVSVRCIVVILYCNAIQERI